MQTVLVSALTAAAVTLLIEYAAKPYLEVRKDRILEAHRACRELVARIELTIAEIPPIQGALPHPLHEKTVEDFLATATEIRATYPKASQSLGFLRRRATRTQVKDMEVHEIAARGILKLYRDDEKVDEPAEPVNKQLAMHVHVICADLLGLRAGLIAQFTTTPLLVTLGAGDPSVV